MKIGKRNIDTFPVDNPVIRAELVKAQICPNCGAKHLAEPVCTSCEERIDEETLTLVG